MATEVCWGGLGADEEVLCLTHSMGEGAGKQQAGNWVDN